jgi:PAS domain S-box-containing protein
VNEQPLQTRIAAPGRRDDQLPGTALPIGFSGSMRMRLPVFALVAVGTVLIAVIPFPHDARREISIAGVLFFVLIAAAFLVPWERLPDWTWLIVPVGYIAVIAIIRDAQGGSDSGLVVVFLLPVVWLSLYGRRLHLLVGLVCLYLALLVPLLVVGPPKYPTIEWRQVAVMATVTTLVASTVYTIVKSDRAYLGDLAQQSRMARQNAREALYARDRLETLLRAATGSAIMGVDPAGTVTFFSAGAEQMLGYRAAEVVGIRSIADFIDPAQIAERRQTIDAMQTALEPVDADTAAEVPWTATRKDGQQRRCVVRVRALPVPVPDLALDDELPLSDETAREGAAASGAPGGNEAGVAQAPGSGGYVVVAIDVTEREELAADRERLFAIQKEVTQSLIEQNTRLRELTKMKDDLVATISHELRTPITSIRGFVELLLDASSDLTKSQMRMLETIERNAQQLQRVSEDLLTDVGAAGYGLRHSFSELDLHELAVQAVHAMETSAAVAGVRLSIEPGEEIPIFGDPTRLHQLIGNLLSNAIKFSPRGGRVHVIVDRAEAYARVQVLDDGPGIPAEERDQLFERFYRLASSNEMGVPGTGLGLAIAKTVAEAHEGFVDIVDTPGWSTTFRVFLPRRFPLDITEPVERAPARAAHPH